MEVGLGKGAAGEERLQQGVMALAPRQGRHAPAAPSRLEDSPALADICSEGWVGRCVAYSGRRRGRRSGLHCKLLLASASLLLSSNKGPAPIPCPRLFYPTPTQGARTSSPPVQAAQAGMAQEHFVEHFIYDA